ncbi:fumarylacetoacetate hydrolase family protein [Chloroflexota bacterium]
MKIVRFAIDNNVRYGILDGDSIQSIEDKPYLHLELSDTHYQLSKVKLLSPCLPAKIVFLGLNYHSRVEEDKMPLPNAPPTFLKPPKAVIGPEDNLTCPSDSHRIDYEGHLGVVIKKSIWRVPIEDALDYVLGYTCFNDITARDLRHSNNPWPRSNDSDTFVSIGPYIETELNPGNVVLETYLNGELKQHANTKDLIYSIPELINFISNVMPLQPGDILATGTPSGTGSMYPDDTVEIKIKSIGTLRNYVVNHS